MRRYWNNRDESPCTRYVNMLIVTYVRYIPYASVCTRTSTKENKRST